MKVLINSKNRNSAGTSNSFTINLKERVDCMYAELIDCQLPNTIYNIRSGINDTVVWNQGADYSFVIPEGRYSIADLISVVQIGMIAADPNTYLITYSASTLKLTITGALPFTFNWVTNATNTHLSNIELGFSLADSSTGTEVSGDQVVQLQNPSKILLQIAELASPNLTDYGVDFTFLFDLNGSTGSLVGYQKGQFYCQRTTLNSGRNFIKTLTCKLVYENGQDVNLNGADWTAVLSCD